MAEIMFARRVANIILLIPCLDKKKEMNMASNIKINNSANKTKIIPPNHRLAKLNARTDIRFAKKTTIKDFLLLNLKIKKIGISNKRVKNKSNINFPTLKFLITSP